MKKFYLLLTLLILFIVGHSPFISEQHGLVAGQSQPTQKQQAIKKGLGLFKAGEFDKSEEVFNEILKRNNNTLIAKEMLAVISFRKQDYVLAEKRVRICLKQNRKSAKAHLVLAGIYREKGNLLASRDHLRKSKKYATSREKETILQYIQKDNKALIEQIEKSAVNENILDYKVPNVGELPYIAVFTFEDTNNEENIEGFGKTFAEMLTTALIKSNRFKVFERLQLDKILEEQALGLTGAIDDETAVDVGKILGIDAIVVGSTSTLQNQIEIDARIVDAENGNAHLAASVSAGDESELRNASNELAKIFSTDADKIPIQRKDISPDN
jgi:TolB-like protein